MSRFAASIRANAPLLVLVAVFYVSVVGLSFRAGFTMPGPMDYLMGVRTLALVVWALLSALLLIDLIRVRPHSPVKHLRPWAERLRLADRAILAAPALVSLVVMSVSFGAMKSAIPLLHAYRLDPILADLDVRIHGQDAWRVIHPLVGYPVVSALINQAYHGWFLALFAVAITFMGMVEQPKLRLQYIIAHALCWILIGTVAATLLASVGPCFYQHFYGDDRFQPLMTYLHDVARHLPMPALGVQDNLRAWSDLRRYGVGGGISAMPSMHMSIVTLFVLAGWSVSRRWGLLATAFFVVIFLGSIHLGYHYAVDGYVSMILTTVIWVVSGWFAQAWLARDPAAAWTYRPQPATQA